jgi:LysM repeat protein
MLKIGSAVHTAHGPGSVTDTETTRGRTQYKVSGQGFSVWMDETKVAAADSYPRDGHGEHDDELSHPAEDYPHYSLGPGYERPGFSDDDVAEYEDHLDHHGYSRHGRNFYADSYTFNNSNPGTSMGLSQPTSYADRTDRAYDSGQADQHYMTAPEASPWPAGRYPTQEALNTGGVSPGEDVPGPASPKIDWFSSPANAVSPASDKTLDKLEGQAEKTLGAGLQIGLDQPASGGGMQIGGSYYYAALGDVDESNSTTLPYDYEPQHPTEMFSTESTMTPDHDVDLDERMRPTNSVTGESAELPYDYPGPNPDLFAKSASYRTASPGSYRHYVQWADEAGLQPGQAETADLYGNTHGVDGFGLMEKFNGQHQAANKHEEGEEGEDHENWFEREEAKHPRLTKDIERGAEFGSATAGGAFLQDLMQPAADAVLGVLSSRRPAGLSDKYIDLPPIMAAANDPVAQFRADPVGYMERTAYRIESSTGLDPRIAQYMDLVEADSMIREAAWSDVRQKAMRLRREGAVDVIDIQPQQIYANVTGDNGTYSVMIHKGTSLPDFTGGHDISNWFCGCEWGKWAFKRKRTFVGRLCSHGLAAYFTMQSAHMSKQPRQQKLPNRAKPKRDMSSYDNSFGYYHGAKDDMPTRPERDYDVKGYSEGDGKLRGPGQEPERLSPDFYKVPNDDDQYFVDVEKDERKTTGPEQIQAKVDKKWAKDHADLDDEATPIVHFSMRKEALTYTADENLLKKLRDLSAESNAENFGNMAQHNHEISEVINELRERGYDANRMVASIRTADIDYTDLIAPGIGMLTGGPAGALAGAAGGWLADHVQSPIKHDDFGWHAQNPFGGGKESAPDAPAKKEKQNTPAAPEGGGDAPAPKSTTPKVNPAGNSGGGNGGGASGSSGGSGSSGSSGGDGGGSDWQPNGNTEKIDSGDYKIQKGDTLSTISDRSGVAIDDLMKGNSQIKNKDLIFADDTLKIPGGSDKPAAAEAATAPPPAPAAAAADSTSGLPAADPGVGGGTGFPANTTGQLTDPGLSAPGQMLHSRRYYADAAEPDVLNPFSGGGTWSSDPALDDPQPLKLPFAVSGGGAKDFKMPSSPESPTDTAAHAMHIGEGLVDSKHARRKIADDNGWKPNPGQTEVKYSQPSGPPAAPKPLSPRGVPDPGPTPTQMTDNSFSSGGTSQTQAQTAQPSDGSKKVLEDDQPKNATPTSGIGDAMSAFNSVMPVVEGIGSAVSNIAQPVISGIGNALSGLLHASVDHTVDGGPNYFSTSEGWVDEYERPDYIDLNEEPEHDLISYRTQPKQASYDDNNDIVRQFQANIGNTALGSGAGGGGTYSDDAISQAAQGFLRTAGRVYSLSEQQDLMDEEHPQGARNLPGLDLRGTHYLEG